MKSNTHRWTDSKARLKLVHTNSNKKYNWLFLPGGPGLGSESLNDLIQILDLPGSLWSLDLPDDGSNILDDSGKNFANWQEALIEATREFENVILVAHSTGGMYALATPEIEKNLIGLILMDSAPNSEWQNSFMKYVENNPIAKAEKLQKLYTENPSNDLLRELTIMFAPYVSINKNLKKILNMLTKLPFNYKSHLWSEENFDKTYSAKWIPQKIPTLIFAGSKDCITPLKLFLELKEFRRKNICMLEVKDASHFPWIDNPTEVKQIFADYYLSMLSK